MGKVQKDIGFQKFIESVKNVEANDYFENKVLSTNANEIKVKSHDHFHEMRNHILNHYDGIEVTKSFQDHNGQVWDCIAIKDQPALKGMDSIQINPPDISTKNPEPKKQVLKQKALAKSFLSATKKDRYGNTMSCPAGYIPVRRMTLEEMAKYETLQNFLRKEPRWKKIVEANPLEADTVGESHKYAHAFQRIDNTGGHSVLSLNKPTVSGTDHIFSLSQHWYVGGEGNNTQTLEAGWQVYPVKYNTMEPCLFIYYTADNYNSIGAYNGEDGAFCQINNHWALGGPLDPFINDQGEAIYELEIAWILSEGKWWLYINGITADHAVGYYPAGVYRGGQMSQHATLIDYGGETVGSASWPEMGNGLFPDSNEAAYQRSINYYDVSGNGVWANLHAQENFPNCYRISLVNDNNDGSYFYYGGPGGNNC